MKEKFEENDEIPAVSSPCRAKAESTPKSVKHGEQRPTRAKVPTRSAEDIAVDISGRYIHEVRTFRRRER